MIAVNVNPAGKKNKILQGKFTGKIINKNLTKT
jgi:hypothetical protein